MMLAMCRTPQDKEANDDENIRAAMKYTDP